MSETCQKLAFTHPIVVLKSGLKNNRMKKLDRVNRPLDELETDQTKFEYLKSLIGEFHMFELADLEQTEEDKIAQAELNSLKEEM